MGFCGTFCCSFCESPCCPPDEGRDVRPPFAPRCFGARLGVADRAGSARRVAEALTDAVTEGDGVGVGLTVADAVEDDGPGVPVPAGDAAPPSPLQAAAPRARATRHTALGSARERARGPAAAARRNGERGVEGRLICYDL
ncbi:hypothetical protein [Streptomyces wuyuanensis]|uniref:hypothetical protein n=1 Tax=Streptomyces wuyuanensis TaxID=1196353 RepID=UPI00115FF210|nr:hypothetical protein [Streptomyces wuyuanensis]